MKLIMLDMDGVINSNELIKNYITNKRNLGLSDDEIKEQYNKDFKNCTELIFPVLWNRLKEIINKTNAKIVWSSDWRDHPSYKRFENGQALFEKFGISGNTLVGYTPIFRGGYRCAEISAWLNSNTMTEKIEKCAVIDDRWDAGEFLPDNAKFFQTNQNYGLTTKIKNEIIKYLND